MDQTTTYVRPGIELGNSNVIASFVFEQEPIMAIVDSRQRDLERHVDLAGFAGIKLLFPETASDYALLLGVLDRIQPSSTELEIFASRALHLVLDWLAEADALIFAPERAKASRLEFDRQQEKYVLVDRLILTHEDLPAAVDFYRLLSGE